MGAKETIRIVSLTSCEWDGSNGRNSTLFGVDAKGRVFRYHPTTDRWRLIGTGRLAKSGGYDD